MTETSAPGASGEIPLPEERSFALNANLPETHAFIQWKGTDVCMDFRCECGEDGHFDGFFAYVVKCERCGQHWEMPMLLFPRKCAPDHGSVVNLTYDEDAAE